MAMVLSAAMMCRYGLDLPGVGVPYLWTLVHTKLAKCGIIAVSKHHGALTVHYALPG